MYKTRRSWYCIHRLLATLQTRHRRALVWSMTSVLCYWRQDLMSCEVYRKQPNSAPSAHPVHDSGCRLHQTKPQGRKYSPINSLVQWWCGGARLYCGWNMKPANDRDYWVDWQTCRPDILEALDTWVACPGTSTSLAKYRHPVWSKCAVAEPWAWVLSAGERSMLPASLHAVCAACSCWAVSGW